MLGWLELLIGFIAGGGLVTVITLPFVIRKNKTQAAFDEFNFCKERIAWLEENLCKEKEMMRVMCVDCCYKDFYQNRLKRLNDRLNATDLKKDQVFAPGLHPDMPVD